MDSRKSDVDAKKAYSEYLISQGYKNIKIISSPSDISAEKNGEVFYFEIKKTSNKENYFGAATLTDWVSDLEKKSNYFYFQSTEKYVFLCPRPSILLFVF